MWRVVLVRQRWEETGKQQSWNFRQGLEQDQEHKPIQLTISKARQPLDALNRKRAFLSHGEYICANRTRSIRVITPFLHRPPRHKSVINHYVF